MKKRAVLCGMVCGWLAGGVVPGALGVDAVFVNQNDTVQTVGGGVIEAQGSTGRIDLPVSLQALNIFYSNFRLAGATANDGTLYYLLSNSPYQPGSFIALFDAHSGASLGILQVKASLSDIAYTNGQLYGSVDNTNTLQVDSIAANGSTQPIFTQAETTNRNPWRLSGAVGGNSLLASQTTATATPTSAVGYVINPSTLQSSQISIPTGSGYLIDTVISSAGTAFTSIIDSVAEPSPQNVASFPAGIAQGPRSASTQYRNGSGLASISDEFSYTYSPSMAAVTQTVWNASADMVGAFDGLVRQPQVVSISGPVLISNTIAPDGTTVGNVNVVNAMTQTIPPYQGIPRQYGTTLFTASVQNSSGQSFSAGTVVGQVTATMNLATAQRGIYYVNAGSTMSGDYSYGKTLDQGRPIQSSSSSANYSFAYDPISSNLVGNGDTSLGTAGWETEIGGVWQIGDLYAPTPGNFGLSLMPNAPQAMRQTLQETTPDSAMLLSFTYHIGYSFLSDAPTDDLQIFLNGEQVGEVEVSADADLHTFQALITDPDLQNLSDASLMFSASTNGSDLNILDLTSISLTAVPEPIAGAMVFLLAAVTLRRRGRVN
jgi:hypothetical protein